MKVRTLKRAAGAVSFEADRIIELADELVQSFVDAGAVEVVECSISVAKQNDDDPTQWEVTTTFTEEAEPERPKRKRK
jgi:hypothetical protein